MGAPGPPSSPQGGQRVSSAEAVFGQQLVLPGDLTPGPEASALSFQTELASNAPPPTRQPRTYAEVAAQPPNTGLQAASYVYVRRGPSFGSPIRGALQGATGWAQIFCPRGWRLTRSGDCGPAEASLWG
jgi:hypothetical protein